MHRRVTILLVDDDDADLMIAARRLRSVAPDRYRLLQASNLEQAISTLRVSPVDAVLLDLNLGATAGPDTVAKLRAADECTLIIALTGHSSPELERACLAAGADQFLDKDSLSRGAELMQTVEFALGRRKPERSRLAPQLQGLLARLEPTSRAEVPGSSSSERVTRAAQEMAAQRAEPTIAFAQVLDEADSSGDPMLTVAALAVRLAQAYFEALTAQANRE